MSKGNFMDVAKTSIFLRFLKVFGGLGSPVELQMVSRDPPGPHFGVVLETQSLHYTDSHESPCKYTLIHANPHVNTDARPLKPDKREPESTSNF